MDRSLHFIDISELKKKYGPSLSEVTKSTECLELASIVFIPRFILILNLDQKAFKMITARY